MICALVVFAALLIVYLLTAAPTVGDEDSGELVAAAHVLGVAHPTGYPLWTVLAKLFDLLPLGPASAFRVAVFSAVSAAGAAALLCWITISLTGLALAGASAGLAFGLWFPTWSQAVRPEVYALEGLLFAWFALALARWDQERTPRNLGWMALAGGAATMHHRSALFALAPGLLAAFWLTRPKRVTVWARGVALFCLPFLCYLYLPLRAATHPPMNWGNPNTLERFLYHALGRQYDLFAFANSWETVLKYSANLVGEALARPGWPSVALAVIGLPLIAWGLVSHLRQSRTITVSLILGSVALFAFIIQWGATQNVKVWLLPVGAVAALFGGVGLSRLHRSVPWGKAGRAVPYLLGAAVCLLLLSSNWARSDLSNQWRHRDRWYAALAQMDKHAIFVAEFDVPLFAAYYLQQVEGQRQDITVIRAQGLWYDWYLDDLADPELRRACHQAWEQVNAQLKIGDSNTPEFWQGTAQFAHLLAQRYRGRRPVYALHGPVGDPIAPPPYFIGLSEDLVRLSFDLPPGLLRRETANAPLLSFPKVELMSFALAKPEANTGELVPFRATWQTQASLSGAFFGLRMIPMETGRAWTRLAGKGHFVQGFPIGYGLRGLAPSQAGTVYEQEGKLMVPNNAPAGDYVVQVSYAPGYPPEYGEWTDLARLRVTTRARPGNRN